MKNRNAIIPNLIGNLQNQFKTIWIPACAGMTKQNVIMKKILFLFAVLFTIHSFSQDLKFKEYSYNELFKMIKAEQDSIFKLKDAIIKPDASTDSLFSYKSKFIDFNTSDYDFKRKDTLQINKELVLDNVHFFGDRKIKTGLYYLQFNKKVSLINMSKASFINCAFLDVLVIKNNSQFKLNTFDKLRNLGQNTNYFGFDACDFKGGVDLASAGTKPGPDEHIVLNFGFKNSNFYALKKDHNPYGNFFCNFGTNNISNLSFQKNKFIGEGYMIISIKNSGSGTITDNDFGNIKVILRLNIDSDRYKNQFKNNRFNKPVFFSMNEDFKNFYVDWFQFKGKIINDLSYHQIYMPGENLINPKNIDSSWSDALINRYLNEYRLENKDAYKAETKQLGDFYAYYKKNHDKESANAVYIELKDLETNRLAVVHSKNPSFKSFFTWKINQFLKVFSAYGTEPARAIIFSMYVILFFAFIYLFFPNHWDSHGKNRLKHRFNFFYKYTSRNAGIQDVYLEEQKNEIENNEAFRSLLISHKEKAPKLFFNLAMPLYKWSVSGTSIYVWLIKRFDFLKGTWQDTEPKARALKSILIGTLFIIALIYDIFIKMLNALMLSINTFTTLGFGEIPIKGLPRYLAIIQGFIGWFMLTIFSVSLISQLLN